MTALLEQFLSEARDFLQGIGDNLLRLEKAPEETRLLNELFRLVHTLKGNSGLFDFPEMTRVLHASEDLMDAVRGAQLAFSRDLADRLMDAMDFVALLCDEVEAKGHIDASRAAESLQLAEGLRGLIPKKAQSGSAPRGDGSSTAKDGGARSGGAAKPNAPQSFEVPANVRMEAAARFQSGKPLHWITYAPVEECFFQGDDPFYTVRQTPDLLWGGIAAREAWPRLAELNAYRCALVFNLLTTASHEALAEHFRYVIGQTSIISLEPVGDTLAVAGSSPAPVHAMSQARSDAQSMILAAQRQILMLDDHPAWQLGRIKAAAAAMIACCRAAGDPESVAEIEAALALAEARAEGSPLLAWLDAHMGGQPVAPLGGGMEQAQTAAVPSPESPELSSDTVPKFGRRAEDVAAGTRSLKVDQAKIDRMMNLVGEIVVSKNALPYLAHRAEDQYGVQELSREIQAQYGVINRIVEEMQDAIMQVCMMPVSFVFQRFPRLVRDISRKLGKEVELVLEGESTEADKSIIESLGDPLIHIIRNSLDHGLETPEVRLAQGKSAVGVLTIRATQEGDRVVIEIMDDGKGIDPAIIKRKAFEKGLIDEAGLAQISDHDAVNLVFAVGLSTNEKVSDLSGRGVGMDVVRSAVEKFNGTIALDSVVGKGTSIRISLPLSMAVTQVMVIESDHQHFGVPMDHVVETVRIPGASISRIKQSQTTVLRNRIVPLKALNSLLSLPSKQKINDEGEFAVLVVDVGGEAVGLIVDEFRESIGIIQKPLGGVLGGIAAYSGSAVMGDGSVLMVLNIKEVL